MTWCEQQVSHLNVPRPITTSMFFQQYPTVAYVIPPWYDALIRRGREYNQPKGKLPLLSTPVGGYTWQTHPTVSEAVEREFDDVLPGEFEGSSDEGGEQTPSSGENENDQ